MKRYKNSLVIKLTLVIALIMGILFSVLIISNSYSIYVVKNNVINSTLNTMRVYMNDFDNSLNNSIRDLNEIVLNVDDISALRSDNEATRYFASIRLNNVLSTKMTSSKYTDGFVIFNTKHDTFLAAYSNKIAGNRKFEIEDYFRLKASAKNYSIDELWSPLKINNTMYFIKAYKFSDTIIGALMKADSLISYIDTTALNYGEQFVLTDNYGNLLTRTGNNNYLDIQYPLPNNKSIVNKLSNKYMMITTSLKEGNARFSIILKEKNIFSGLSFIQWVIIVLGVLSILIMIFIIYYIHKEILQPIRRLIVGTRQVEQGNLEYQVETSAPSTEFQTLNGSFNSMIKEIKTLKIESYEEKIELQRAELKYLQMQIRPHFFLNAITTIHSMTFKNKNEEIRTFIDALSNHLRYMFTGGLVKVPIKVEVEHVKNYILMQEIKFPDSVFYVIDMQEQVEQQEIPQFLIQTFVENSFKYAMTLEETLSIFIKAELYNFNGNDLVRIIIEDDGEGFPQDILDKVNNNIITNPMDGYRIGISNVKRTLALMYGKDNLLKISNVEPTGGRVEVFIPIEKGD